MSGLRYFWGEEVSSAVVPTQKRQRFMEMPLMLSAYAFLKMGRNYKRLEEAGIREFIGLDPEDPRRIMMDSGGFRNEAT